MSIIHQRPHSGGRGHNDFWPQKVRLLMGIQLLLKGQSVHSELFDFVTSIMRRGETWYRRAYIFFSYYNWTKSAHVQQMLIGIEEWPWEFFDHTSVQSDAWVSLCKEEQARWCVLVQRVGRGVPHVVSPHSDKLCSVDMPRALNKPVAAPRVDTIAPRAVDMRLKGEWMWAITMRDCLVLGAAHWVLSHILSWALCNITVHYTV